MKIIRTIAEMQMQSREWQMQGRRIALVPTMGALHEGHLSLVRLSRQKADLVVVSIFVNPAQFGENEDFSVYPRDLEKDQDLCREYGVAAIFAPTAVEMYDPDFSTWVVEDKLSLPLCGAFRPGHFRGVATVVVKLFNAVLPNLAVFGQKDAQQVLVLERVVRDLNIPVELLVAPVFREADGLAMSSRNRYLSTDQRQRATAIYHGLEMARQKFVEGERDSATLVGIVERQIAGAGGDLQYIEIRSREQLRRLSRIDRPAILAVAAFFGQTRLIDNCPLDC